jgi:glutamyl-Q tRNA(Asp) synthetase
LHLGSLYTALASFLDARSQNGQWLLRIDDLDTPRNVKGAAESIVKTLDMFGLFWDGCVAFQSQQLNVYNDILSILTKNQLAYPCLCSRKTLAAIEESSLNDVYPGTCRDRKTPPNGPYSLRIKTDHRVISFQDALQGSISHSLEKQPGDFIIKRKDQIIAYQFAVVIDDNLQQINHVVRGVDLLESTARQIYLQQILGLATPDYMHVPIIIDQHGYKLSKQTLASAVDTQNPQTVVFDLLTLLNQDPTQELVNESLTDLLTWGIAHWNPAPLKNSRTISQITH